MGKIKLLLYCTKSKYRLFYDYIDNKYRYGLDRKKDKFNAFNGKIVAECDYEVEEIKSKIVEEYDAIHCEISTNKISEEALFNQSCLTRYEMFSYLKNDFLKKGMPKGYAIHIKNLHIFAMPRELENYKTNKAPQNMMHCYGINTGDKYILISIRPEWLCKILNGEKTIEVRKKVLKEMMPSG